MDKQWWNQEDDEKKGTAIEERVPASSVELQDVQMVLDELDEKASRGVALSMGSTVLALRAFKACQLLKERIDGAETPKDISGLTELAATVKMGDFDFTLEELLDVPDEVLDRVILCLKETLDNPVFADAVKKELGGPVLLQIASGPAVVDAREE